MHIHAYSAKNRVFSQKYVSLASNPGRHPFFCPKICCFYFRFLEIFTPAVIPTTAAATTTMTNTATGAEPFFVVPFPLTIFPVSSAPVSELAFAGPLTLSSGSILIAATSFPLLCTFATFLCLLFCGIRPGCVAALCSRMCRISCRSSMISGICSHIGC